ncbi:hypothetical protein [Arthrobacter sp. SD76]|uniref:hypothetical protein n=1 Tax=Arthrobacter sp. SD76 TaxID=3415007 RepID=UPI003C7762AB
MDTPPQSGHINTGTGNVGAANIAPPIQAVPAPASSDHNSKAVAGLVLAVVAPASLLLTAPFARFAMLLTFPYSGPSQNPWLASLVFWSLPLIFGTISASLGGYALRKSGLRTKGSGLALAALCINGVIFIVGLIMTLRFVSMMR